MILRPLRPFRPVRLPTMKSPPDFRALFAVGKVAWRTLMGGRLRLKVGAALTLLSAAVAVLWEGRGLDPASATDIANAAIVTTAMLGASVVVLVFTLFRAGEEAATGVRTPDDWDANPTAFHGMLLIIPTGAAVGAALLMITAGLLAERAITTDANSAVLFTVPLVIGAWALNMVLTSSRFLFSYAAEQAERVEKAQAEVIEARLAALQAQMNPHFMFNTLNTVAALVRTDAARAERTVENLASVLRRTLDRSRRTMTTVGEEVDYVRDYLGIERERLGDRLVVEWSVSDEVRTCELPTMTLQPLVENSLKHGIGARIEGGRVEIRASRSGDSLVLDVIDDGPGFSTVYSDGTGLGNLRRRLEVLYGEPYGMEVVPASGAHVRVRLPFVEFTMPESDRASESQKEEPTT